MTDGKRRLPIHSEEEAAGGTSRRTFLSLMGASIALAGASSCTKQPPEAIVPYVTQPEEASPGRSLFYATAMLSGGYATGLLVRSLTGRPVKIEGNPDHPASLGATDAAAQASILTLYDPDRSAVITRLGRITTWERFTSEIGKIIGDMRARGGTGLRILTERVTSPSLADQILGLLGELPAARWHRFEPAGEHNAAAGARIALGAGAPAQIRYDLLQADVILLLDSDLLASGPGSLRYARDFSRRRAEGDAGAPGHTSTMLGASPLSPGMNRLYSIESTPTCSGTLADHRLALRPSEIALFAAAVAAEMGVPGVDRALPAAYLDARARRWAAAIADDLRRAGGRCVVAAGEQAAPAVHALAAVMNDALGAVASGAAVYTDPVEIDPVDHIASLRELCDDIRAGRVTTLVIIGGNPVYTAPADLGFREALLGVPLRAHLALYADETSELCHYHIPEAHYLEAWGDGRAFDGTATIIQPLITPLYGGRSAIELVAALRGRSAAQGLDLVRTTWQARFPAGQLYARFRAALLAGVVAGTSLLPRPSPITSDAARKAFALIAAAGPPLSGAAELELAIRPDPTIDDGRFAPNAWLQELPKPQTKLTWDNAALLSPKTASDLGVSTEDLITLTLQGRSVTAPVIVLPGQSDRTITVHLGYGRTRAGAATGRGFDAYRLRSAGSLWQARGLAVQRSGGRHPLAITQGHFRFEGRPHIRSATLGELRHDPAIIAEMGEDPTERLFPVFASEGRAWGMVIDNGACTACSACVVACQAENNIPVVGKEQVIAGREMHWLRIDQYYEGPAEDPIIYNEPMMCVHCEAAPCEYVCPVAATTHSREGLNEMTYNRCVGTRYCANNCPYKVRRFNFYEYNGDVPKSLRLQKNPDVTVRSRGVMEKCTYCVQRINAARIAAEREDRSVRDGEVVTACQAACPTGAILFGDINDPTSRVRRLKADPRGYGVLAELNTRPRTTHLARIWNPNPAIGGERRG